MTKYLFEYFRGGTAALAEDGYFTGFITADVQPMILLCVFLFAVAFIVFRGVNKGIEASSKVIMPLLLLLSN